MGVEIFRDEAFLHPLQLIRAQRFGQANGIFDVEGHPAIEHQFAVIADLLPRFGHEFFVFVDTVQSVGRTVGAG